MFLPESWTSKQTRLKRAGVPAEYRTARTKPDFFFSSRRRHTRCGRDWSSDVCSSDLIWGMRKVLADMQNRIGPATAGPFGVLQTRSEERRVGKECRSRWSPYH